MKLSTRSTYGLRAMMALAHGYGQGPMLLRDIAQRQQLPTTYLEQLMVPLRKARLVSATRGVNGGYVLTRQPEEITLCEVIEILEGPIELVDCAGVVKCKSHPCSCALKSILNDAGALLINFFNGITLADLNRKQQVALSSPMPDDSVLSYSI